MEPTPVIGQLRFSRNERLVEGWCWAPGDPEARQVVQVFADDQFIAALVAGWLDPRLLRQGIGDGRHAFALRLPETDGPDYRTVVARDRASGQVFAQADGETEAAFDPFSARVEALLAAVPLLASAVEAAVAPAQRPRLAPALRELGLRLSDRAQRRAPARAVGHDSGPGPRTGAASVALAVDPVLAGAPASAHPGVTPAVPPVLAGAGSPSTILPAPVLRGVNSQPARTMTPTDRTDLADAHLPGLALFRRQLADQYRATRLPFCARPRVSVILTGDSLGPAARTIERLAPVLAETEAEVLLLDPARDPSVALLPTIWRNLRFVYGREPHLAGDLHNLGVREARGATLLFLDSEAAPPSAAALAEFAARVPAGDWLALGRRWLAPVRQLGVAGSSLVAPLYRARAPLGLRLALPRATFLALGQFDIALAAAPGLECADLFLKAALSGIATELWDEPGGALPQGTPRHHAATEPDTRRMLQALATFRARWHPPARTGRQRAAAA